MTCTVYVTDDSYGPSCKGGWVTVTVEPEPEPVELDEQ